MASATVEQSKPPRQFGKTALMLHGLGVLFLLAGAGTLAALGAEKNESYTFLGFGGAAFGVLTAWAALLLVRSYIAREQSRFSFALLLILLFEFTSIFLEFEIRHYDRWLSSYAIREIIDIAIAFCIPALTAFLFIVLGVSVPLVNFLTQRVNDSRRAALRRTWLKRAFLTAMVLILPPILYSYSIFTLYRFGMRNADGYPHLNVGIARLAPKSMSDAIENGLLQPGASPSETQLGLLNFGCVSKERLSERLADLDVEIFMASWHGLTTSYPEYALDICIEFGKRKKVPASWTPTVTSYIVQHASEQQIQAILDAGKVYNAAFRSQLLGKLTENRYPAVYHTDILRLAAEESTCRGEVAALELGTYNSRQEFNKSWSELFSKRDWTFRNGLAYVIPYLEIPLTDQIKLFRQCWNDSDPSMRRAAMASACLTKRTFNWSSADADERKAWIMAMQNYIDDSDLFVRRSAVHILATFTDFALRDTPDDSNLYKDHGLFEANPVSGEDEERETVRAAAKKWLATH